MDKDQETGTKQEVNTLVEKVKKTEKKVEKPKPIKKDGGLYLSTNPDGDN